jgi:hypothetical protein
MERLFEEIRQDNASEIEHILGKLNRVIEEFYEIE